MVKLVLEKRGRDEPTNFTSNITPKRFKKPAPDLNPGEIMIKVWVLSELEPYYLASYEGYHAEAKEVFDEDSL